MTSFWLLNKVLISCHSFSIFCYHFKNLLKTIHLPSIFGLVEFHSIPCLWVIFFNINVQGLQLHLHCRFTSVLIDFTLPRLSLWVAIFTPLRFSFFFVFLELDSIFNYHIRKGAEVIYSLKLSIQESFLRSPLTQDWP